VSGPHIRPAVDADRQAIHRLAVDNAMFAEEELGGIDEVFDGYLAGELDGHRWLVVDAGPDVVAAAYVAPEPFADRLWNLYFIAVDPAAHGGGIGRSLMAHIEALLADLGESEARILLVETSSTAQYDRTREVYARYGFDEEARIREYYGPGDDKVVFWKRLDRP
jgi:ribosomal protein S18 acetylase RimI-like enzyme